MPIPIRPTATNDEDAARWELTSARHRLMDGAWYEDLRGFMQQHVDPGRLAVWGAPNQSFNLFKMLVSQVNCIYDEEASVRNNAFTPESEKLLGLVMPWPRMQKHAGYVLGMRESAVRIEHSRKYPLGINLRLVTPDYLETEAPLDAPTLPHLVREARPRKLGGEHLYLWDTWDVRDPERPSFTIRRGGPDSEDVTAEVMTPQEWAWRSPVDQRPYLPWTVYHAADAGVPWDPAEWHELVHGTLSVAMLWTFWMHAVKEASWDQKYAIDLLLQGVENRGRGRAAHSRVAVDPASLLMFVSKDGRGSVGSIAASIDPMRLAEAIVMYQSLIAVHLGISASDITFGPSEAKSGVAMSLTRDGLRRVQRRYFPQFRAGDEELVQKIAWVHNAFRDPVLPALPTEGYRVAHTSLPLTTEEIRGILERNAKLLELGLKSEVDVLIEMEPGLSRDEAMAQLRGVAQERAALRRSVTAPPGVAGRPTAGAAPVVEEKASDTALNGAQVTAAQGIIMSVAAGELPRGTGVAMLVEFFNLDPVAAERLMGEIGDP